MLNAVYNTLYKYNIKLHNKLEYRLPFAKYGRKKRSKKRGRNNGTIILPLSSLLFLYQSLSLSYFIYIKKFSLSYHLSSVRSKIIVLNLTKETTISNTLLIHGNTSHALTHKIWSDVFQCTCPQTRALPNIHPILSSCTYLPLVKYNNERWR